MPNQTRIRQRNYFIKFFIIICLCFIAANSAFSQTLDPKLVELRKQFAVNYMKPEAHFALAQYYLNKGNKVQAFFIMEYARRYRFSEKDFDAAFKNFFGDNSPEPDDKAKDAFEEAYRLLKSGKTDEAEQWFIKAAKLAPKSAFIQSWVGRFFLKAKSDSAKSLPYYFNAYFLDPHAYDTEHAEWRIRNIASADADIKFAELVKSGKSLTEISKDANPLIVMRAIEQMAKDWKKDYIKPLSDAMSNDDSIVRWVAFATLFKNADTSFDETLTALLNDTDLRKRGLAAYAVVERWKEKRFEILSKMLGDNAELIRFDALSALALQGGEPGVEILKKHQKVETNSKLKELIDRTLQGK
jgi:tetratricopeptide (TPR) repeat protein